MASPNSKSLRHPLLLHGSRLCSLYSRYLFALADCGRLAGVRTQVDMSRLTGSKSKYRERHKQGHAPSGHNGASQDFEQVGHALVRQGCGAARCVWLVRPRLHRSIPHHASSPDDRTKSRKQRIEKSQRRVAEKFATGCCWRKSAGICMLSFAADR